MFRSGILKRISWWFPKDVEKSEYRTGKAFVSKYYKYSPGIAKKMNSKPINFLIKQLFFNPLYQFINILNDRS